MRSGGVLRAGLFLAGVVALCSFGCSDWSRGGATFEVESEFTPIGSPFATTLTIPDRDGFRGTGYVQTSSPPLGVFAFDLDAAGSPLPFEFFNLREVIQGIPDGLVVEDDRDLAFVSTSGQVEGVWVLDYVQGFRLLAAFSYTGTTLELPRPAEDSGGNVATSVRPSFTAGAACMGGKVYVPTSNYSRSGSNPVCPPGTVLVVGLDETADPPVFTDTDPPQVILTSGFNPTEVTPFGERILLVTNSGVLAIRDGAGVPLTPGSVDVLDTENDCIVASYPLGMGAPALSSIGIAAQRLPGGETAYRGYLGSAAYNHVYELDLTGLDAYLGGCPDPAEVPQLEDQVLAGAQPGRPPIVATSQAPFTSDYVVQVAVNTSGTRAYATGFNSGTLAVLDLSSEVDPDGSLAPSPKAPAYVIQATEAMPTQNESGPGPVAVRHGVAGEDYTGPDVYLVTGAPIGELRRYVTP